MLNNPSLNSNVFFVSHRSVKSDYRQFFIWFRHNQVIAFCTLYHCGPFAYILSRIGLLAPWVVTKDVLASQLLDIHTSCFGRLLIRLGKT